MYILGDLKTFITVLYTAFQKFGISKIFFFFKEVSNAHQGCSLSIL